MRPERELHTSPLATRDGHSDPDCQRMRVVLDTNVFVAAGFKPRSHSARLIEGVRNRSLEMVWHRTTREETRKMLTRIPRVSWQAVEGLFLPEHEVQGTLDLSRYDFVPDADDRKFAALGELADCPIITSDDDLLSNRDRLSVAVVTPREFIEALHYEDGLGQA